MATAFKTYKTFSGYKIVDSTWFIGEGMITFRGKDPKKNHLVKIWQKNDAVKIKTEIVCDKKIEEYINPDTEVAFNVLWHSLNCMEGTSLHGKFEEVVFNNEYDESFFIEGIIPGQFAAGTVELRLVLYVRNKKTEETTDLLRASQTGEIIYEDYHNLILEGEQSQFPVGDTNFENAGYPKEALYFLKRNFPNIDISFSTAYRLYFNNQHPLYSRINNIKDDEARDFLLNMIIYDVYKQLITDVLNDETFTLQKDDVDDTELHTVRTVMTQIINTLITRYFQGEDINSLREMVKSNDPDVKNMFNCKLQAYLLTFGEEDNE